MDIGTDHRLGVLLTEPNGFGVCVQYPVVGVENEQRDGELFEHVGPGDVIGLGKGSKDRIALDSDAEPNRCDEKADERDIDRQEVGRFAGTGRPAEGAGDAEHVRCEQRDRQHADLSVGHLPVSPGELEQKIGTDDEQPEDPEQQQE